MFNKLMLSPQRRSVTLFRLGARREGVIHSHSLWTHEIVEKASDFVHQPVRSTGGLEWKSLTSTQARQAGTTLKSTRVRKEASPWYVTSHAMEVENSGYPTIVRVYETGALIGRARVVFGVSVQGRG